VNGWSVVLLILDLAVVAGTTATLRAPPTGDGWRTLRTSGWPRSP
jgi:hypothetical protein